MMLYLFMLFALALLAGVTVFFFTSLRSKEVPANARLIIDAWNSVHDDWTEDDKG